MTIKEYHRKYNRNRYHIKRNHYISELGGKCAECGSTDNLNFDHIDASSKTLDVGKLLNYSKARIDEEIKKCQLLCESCHINKTKKLKDGYNKRACGIRINNAKLTEAEVAAILTMCMVETDSTIAAKYSVTRECIRDIRIGKTWKHIPRQTANEVI